MNFDHWLKYGIEQGFCGPPVCSTHDGIPISQEEDAEWDFSDPCIHVIRPYKDEDHKESVEGNHLPSVWRDTWSTRD